MFSIGATAMHPSTAELEVGFKYRRVDLTHARYLDEQLWLPAPQLTRHFVRYTTRSLNKRQTKFAVILIIIAQPFNWNFETQV